LLTWPWAQVGKCACDIDVIRACANPIDIVVATSAMTNRFNMFLSLIWRFCHVQFSDAAKPTSATNVSTMHSA
jgi:hypothetical protein